MNCKRFFEEITSEKFVIKTKYGLDDIWLEPLIIGDFVYFVGYEKKPSKDIAKEFQSDKKSWNYRCQTFHFAKYEKKTVWVKKCEILFAKPPAIGVPNKVIAFSSWDWEKVGLTRDTIYYNFLEDPCAILQREFSYEFDNFAKNILNKFKLNDEEYAKRAKILVSAPYLSVLATHGYAFAKEMLFFKSDYQYRSCQFAKLKPLCKNGESVENIFKVPKEIYESLKNEPDLRKWDEIRKLRKKNNVSIDAIAELNHLGLNSAALESFTYILKAKYEGENIITMPELLNYLNEIVIIHGMHYEESLPIIKHNVSSYLKLGHKPVFNARTINQEASLLKSLLVYEQNAIIQNRIIKHFCDKECFNDSVDNFRIRTYIDRDDLIQDFIDLKLNIFALYYSSSQLAYPSGNMNVYTVRKEDNPEESFGCLVLFENNKQAIIFGENGEKINDPDVISAVNKWLNRDPLKSSYSIS